MQLLTNIIVIVTIVLAHNVYLKHHYERKLSGRDTSQPNRRQDQKDITFEDRRK